MSNFKVEYISGIVVDSQKHTQTHVYSEGGGGRVGATGGTIKAPQVKSYNTTKHDIFLKLNTDQEVHVSFELDNIAVRNGHRITLLAVFHFDKDTGCYARLYNHTTEILYNVFTVDQWRSLAYMFRPEADKAASELKKLAQPQSKSLFGFFKKLTGSLEKMSSDITQGWHEAGKFTNAGKPLTQQELNSPLAIELEQVIAAATPKMQESIF
jgi:hypothetical protein